MTDGGRAEPLIAPPPGGTLSGAGLVVTALASVGLFAGAGILVKDPQVLVAVIVLAALVFAVIFLSHPIIGLHVTVFVTPVFSPKLSLGFANLSLHQAIIMALSFILVFVVLRRGFSLGWRDWLPVLLFLAAFLVSFMRAEHLPYAARWLLYILVPVSAWWIALAAIHNRQALRELLGFLLAGLCGLLLSTLVSNPPHTWLSGRHRVTGGLVFDNPNSLGNYLALVLPFLLAVALVARPRGWRRPAFGALFGLACLLLLATFSRSSWLGAACGLAFVLALLKPGRLVWLGLVVVLLFLASDPVTHRVKTVDSGIRYRVLKIGLALQKFQERPLLGHGPGAFQYYAETSNTPYLQRHATLENLYALLLFEEGIVGLALFLLLGGSAVVSGWRAFLRLQEPLHRGLALGSAATWCALFMISVGEAALFFPKYNWFLGLTLALPPVLVRLERRGDA